MSKLTVIHFMLIPDEFWCECEALRQWYEELAANQIRFMTTIAPELLRREK